MSNPIQPEPLAPLSAERVCELTELTRNAPDVAALAMEVERSRDAIRRISLTGVWGDGGIGSGSPSGGGVDLDALLHVGNLEAEIAKLRARIAALEDAITEAGIFIVAGDITSAMKRLSVVMGPDVLRRQGI